MIVVKVVEADHLIIVTDAGYVQVCDRIASREYNNEFYVVRKVETIEDLFENYQLLEITEVTIVIRPRNTPRKSIISVGDELSILRPSYGKQQI